MLRAWRGFRFRRAVILEQLRAGGHDVLLEQLRARRDVEKAGAHEKRFSRTGDMRHLQASIERLERALARLGPPHPERGVLCGRLGCAYLARFWHPDGDELAELNATIEWFEEAIAAIDYDHPEIDDVLSNLSLAYL